MGEYAWEILQVLLFFAGAFAAYRSDGSLDRRISMLEQVLMSYAIEKVRFVDEDDEEDGDD